MFTMMLPLSHLFQLLSGEVLTPGSANQQDDTRADIRACEFWGQQQSTYFLGFHPNTQLCTNTICDWIWKNNPNRALEDLR